MLAQRSIYAIRAAAALVQHPPGERVLAQEIAAESGVPLPYLSKILGVLAAHGVLESYRGRSGGFRLARDPEEIRFMDLVRPFEPSLGRTRCLLRDGYCGGESSCEVHSRWARLDRALIEFLETTTLAEIAASRGRGCEGE
jgi:Rrf2 family protein